MVKIGWYVSVALQVYSLGGVCMKMMCPFCGLSGDAPESLRGKKIRCPKCQLVFQVTDQVTMEEEVAVETVMTPESPVYENPQSTVPQSEEDHVTVCAQCGFVFSPRFTGQVEEQTLCALCADSAVAAP